MKTSAELVELGTRTAQEQNPQWGATQHLAYAFGFAAGRLGHAPGQLTFASMGLEAEWKAGRSAGAEHPEQLRLELAGAR